MYYKYIKESAYKKQGEAERLTDLLQNTDFKEPNVRRAIRANRNSVQPQSEAYGYIWTDHKLDERYSTPIQQALYSFLDVVHQNGDWEIFVRDNCKNNLNVAEFYLLRYIFMAPEIEKAFTRVNSVLKELYENKPFFTTTLNYFMRQGNNLI